jgi:PIN domain
MGSQGETRDYHPQDTGKIQAVVRTPSSQQACALTSIATFSSGTFAENGKQQFCSRLSRKRKELSCGRARCNAQEVVFFMRPGEVSATMSLLSRFKTAPVTQELVDDGGEIYRKYHPTHGIDVNDAILAATVAATGGNLYTLNVKHYPMPDIVVVRGW